MRRTKRDRSEDNTERPYENKAICQACGKEKHVNSIGFCEDCWITFAHFRKGANE